MRISIDPSISWGDITLGVGLVCAGILAFADVSANVSMNAIAVEHIENDVKALSDLHQAHLEQERADRILMREELRDDLRRIEAKLDRMMES